MTLLKLAALTLAGVALPLVGLTEASSRPLPPLGAASAPEAGVSFVDDNDDERRNRGLRVFGRDGDDDDDDDDRRRFGRDSDDDDDDDDRRRFGNRDRDDDDRRRSARRARDDD